MSRWSKRTDEEKKRIFVEQSGYPTDPKQLEAKLNSFFLMEAKFKYLREWIEFHRKAGVIDSATLDKMFVHLAYEIKMHNFGQSPWGKMATSKDQLNFMVYVSSNDSPFPEVMKKEARAALTELMGPDAGMTFTKTSLPDDYVPSWERQLKDSKEAKQNEAGTTSEKQN